VNNELDSYFNNTQLPAILIQNIANDFEIIKINDSFTNYYNRLNTSIVGKKINDLFYNYPDVLNAIVEANLTGKSKTNELAIRLGKNDKIFKIIFNVFKIGQNRLVIELINNPRKKIFGNRLIELISSVQKILDSDLVSFTLIDSDLKIIGFNNLSKYNAKLIYDKDIKEGISFYEFVKPDNIDGFQATITKVLNNEKVLVNAEIKDMSGINHNYKMNFIPIKDKQGKVINILITLIDVTAEKKYEKELYDAKVHAEESDKLKTAFLSNLSHEVRTPMNAIKGFVNLMLEPGFDETERLTFGKIIKDNTDDLLTLINDVLELSLIESHQYNLTFSDFSVNQLMIDLFEEFISKANDKLLKLEPMLPAFDTNVYSDRRTIYKILKNLISNAIKFTEKGIVEYGYTNLPNNISFFVKDTGIGIDPKNHIAIFDRFHQLENYLTRNYGGTGLGLSLTKALSDLLNGKIHLNSEIGKGSLFRVSIPLQAEHNEEFYKVNNYLKTLYDLKRTVVLIVEDDDISRKVLHKFIEHINGIAISTSNTKEALKLLFDTEGVKILISDIVMDGMNGIELSKIVKENYPDIKIILQTAYIKDYERNNPDLKICDELIYKPIFRKEFYELISKLV